MKPEAKEAEAEQKSPHFMKWLRETRDRIYEETRGMSPEEHEQWAARWLTEPFLLELWERRIDPGTSGARAEASDREE